MIFVRNPETIYQARGTIENGTFQGRWHFSFDEYDDPDNRHFGTLRVFNDDTLSPGAVWPLHPHREIEVVTYCADGEFRHADEHGKGGVLKKGWVQHTTVGRGMFHSEINNRSDTPMRFIQMWFFPERQGLEPSVEQKAVERKDRANRFFPLVSRAHSGALPIRSDARVFSSFLDGKKEVDWSIETGRGVYLYVIEGGPVQVSGHLVPGLGAGKITGESKIEVSAQKGAELLLLDVKLI
jgi:quercetin 2,3-dioxygenase